MRARASASSPGSAAPQTLALRAVEASAANRIAFYTVTVRNEADVTVALFRGTVYRTSQHHDVTTP